MDYNPVRPEGILDSSKNSNRTFLLDINGLDEITEYILPIGTRNQSWGNLTGNGTNLTLGLYDWEEQLGPKRLELYKVVPITVIYCIIFITGIIGNISTCVVIARNKYMQTATNYYLFNLAIADLLLLVLGLPQETYSIWSAYPYIFGETFCILRTMAAETSTYASILTITAFTVERYVAICHPMKAQTMSSLRRATKAIIVIWIVSGICSIPIVVQYGVVYMQSPYTGEYIVESALCAIHVNRYLEHAFEVSTFLFFLTPMTIITVLYALIGLAVRKSTLSRAGSDSSTHSEHTGSELRAQQQARARRAVLKMLDRPRSSSNFKRVAQVKTTNMTIAVVVAFFICWAPFHTQRLLVIYMKGDWTKNRSMVILHTTLFYASGILYYVSSVINPILYNIMSLKFRQAFINTIKRPCYCRAHRKRNKYKTYRFNSRHLGTDTNLTLIHLNLNGCANKLAGKHKSHLGCHKYIPGRSNSSSFGSSSPRLAQLQEGCDPFDDVVAEPSGVERADHKSCHSFHYQRPNSSVVNPNFRPYHSYA